MAGTNGAKRGGSNGGGGSSKGISAAREEKKTKSSEKSWKDVKNLEDITTEQFQSISSYKEAQEFGDKFGLGKLQESGSYVSDGHLRWASFEKDSTVKSSEIDFESLSSTSLSKSFDSWFKSNKGKLKGKDSIDIDNDSGFVTVWRATKSASGWSKDYFEPISAVKTTSTFITSSGKSKTEKPSISKSTKPGVKDIKWEYAGSEDY